MLLTFAVASLTAAGLSKPVAVAATTAAPTPQPAAEGGLWTCPGAAGQEIVGPDGGKMVWVPAGEFMMGSPSGNPDAMPAHKVQFTKGFWLGKCEVTNAQFKAFCNATKYEFPPRSDQPADHPVAFVNWDDCVAYCKFYKMTLPTEAQWEYAARGPKDPKFPWGDDFDPRKCCEKDNLGPNNATYPVGSFPQSASWCGALDMAGNVWEWCQDFYGAKYYGKSPLTDPEGPATGTYRVVRGGGWASYGGLCGASVRSYYLPFSPYKHGGFRCVVVPGG